MKFRELLTKYRDRARLNKTELAQRLDVGGSYIMLIESGKRNPPPIPMCEKMADILSLSKEETENFINQARLDRAKQETKELLDKGAMWLSERERKYARAKEICTDEILEALTDPVAVKALLATYKSKEDIKRIIQEIVENLSRLSKDRRNEILRLCQ